MNVLVKKGVLRVLSLSTSLAIIFGAQGRCSDDASKPHPTLGSILPLASAGAGGEAPGGDSPLPSARRVRSGSVSSGSSNRSSGSEAALKRAREQGVVADVVGAAALKRSATGGAVEGSPRREALEINQESWEYAYLAGRIFVSDEVIRTNLGRCTEVVGRVGLVSPLLGTFVSQTLSGKDGGVSAETTIPGVVELNASVSSAGSLDFASRVRLFAQGAVIYSSYLVAAVSDSGADHPLDAVVARLKEVQTDLSFLGAGGAPCIASTLPVDVQLLAGLVLAKYQSDLLKVSGMEPGEFAQQFIFQASEIASGEDSGTGFIVELANRSVPILNPYQLRAYQLMVLYRGYRLRQLHKKFTDVVETLSPLVDAGSLPLAAARTVYGQLPDNALL